MPPTPTPTPTPSPVSSPFKKFLVPGMILAGLILVGILLFTKGGTVDQGAALFSATKKTASIQTGVSGSLATNTQPLPCLVGSTTPQIKVMSPNGGETYQAGQQITVKWSTCNIPATEAVLIEMVRANSINNPIGSWVLLSQSTPNDGIETFTLNSNLVLGTYELAVKRNSGLPGDDVSDNLFTINQNIAAACNGLNVDNYAEVVYDPSETTFIVNSSGQGGGSPGYRNPFVESGKTVVSPFVVYNSACDLYLKKIELSLLSPVGVPSISATYKVRDAFNGNILATAVVPFNTSPKTVTLDLSANPITVPALQNRKFVIEVSNVTFPILTQGVGVVPGFTFGIKDVVMEHALNGDTIVHKNYKSWIPVINLK